MDITDGVTHCEVFADNDGITYKQVFRVRSRVPYRSWEINFFESFVKQNVGVSRVVSEVLLE